MDAMMEDITKAEEETGYTAACDWWSMGVVVYELVAGTAPFWAERVEDTYARIMRSGVSRCQDGTGLMAGNAKFHGPALNRTGAIHSRVGRCVMALTLGCSALLVVV
jgi:hypothetical protein